ncbi:gp53-like domain-containing protein [Arsenophonus sp. PmNCSU2021_1]|uniref:gp53-like domain-containing protein n=1 Tax=Arsenophonus sp. PmNCSU2021_1 TaxID=3118989 RepID=UPI002FF1DB76
MRNSCYTKTEVDAKINSAKWTVKKSANGWLKDPNTGLIIQWGYRSKEGQEGQEGQEGNSYTINFPTAFSSSVYSITTSSKAHNTSSGVMYIGIAYDVTKKGFNYYVRHISGNSDTFMDGYYWMAIGV